MIKGWFGEKTIAFFLRALPKDEYAILNDIILSTGDGTTQIHHIVVSIYGIFVIETKNYKGWIHGTEHSAQWTQNIYGNKKRFMNPLHQNYAHVKAIEARLARYPLPNDQEFIDTLKQIGQSVAFGEMTREQGAQEIYDTIHRLMVKE